MNFKSPFRKNFPFEERVSGRGFFCPDFRVIGMFRPTWFSVCFRSFHSVFFLGFASVFISCSERIEVDLSSQNPVLVVDGRITTELQMQTVRLSRSSSWFDTALQSLAVSGADVAVINGEKRYGFEEDTSSPGVYLSREPFAGEPGNTYCLEVFADAGRTGIRSFYRAEETMPVLPGLDSVGSRYGRGRNMFSRRSGWSILLYGEDGPCNDYYGAVLYIDGKNYNDSIQGVKLIDDKLIAGEYIDGIPAFFFPAGNLFSGSMVEMRVMNYTQRYFQYLQDVRNTLSPSMPVFGGAPSNCRGNISGGAFGYFAVYAVVRDSVTLSAQDSIDWVHSQR